MLRCNLSVMRSCGYLVKKQNLLKRLSRRELHPRKKRKSMLIGSISWRFSSSRKWLSVRLHSAFLLKRLLKARQQNSLLRKHLLTPDGCFLVVYPCLLTVF
uniref:Uncharacterized protein n=2 Tax=Helianthus annuus TaxID=4232 RepID=A0A251RZ16_HELAN